MNDGVQTSATKARSPHAASRATQAAILDAALEIFAEDGFRAGSLRLIAARVGMSEAGLLHHFPSKKALLLAVLERRRETVAEMMSASPADAEPWLRGILRMASGVTQDRTSVRFFCAISAEATSPNHPAHSYFVARYETLRDQLTAAFEELRSQGRMKGAIRSREAAAAAIALMDGLQIQWLLDPESVDIARSLREHFTAFVDIDLDSAFV